MSRNIVFLIYPDFQLLDAAGPIAAFEVAGRMRPGTYSLRVIARDPGLVRSSSGISLPAVAMRSASQVDTLIVSGGDGSRAAAQCPRTARFIQACGRSARRTTSVCSGTYLLAAAGLLDGKLATTHWSRSTDFKQRFPKVRLEPDRIFVREGRFWTSAGVTAGIDLALALVEQDLGERVARATARQLVVYYRRPGGQSQFSALLQMDRSSGKFAALLEQIRASLCRRHSVAELAEQACMSPRQFFRAFQADTGMTPAKAVEHLRADAARAALRGSARSVQDVARSCGFGSAERMRRAFQRLYGLSPLGVKQRPF